MTWMDRYERDVLGRPGAARYTRTVSSRSLHPDSGIPVPAEHMTPALPPRPPTPVVIPSNQTLFGELLHGLIDGMLDFLFGRRGPL